MFLVGYRIHQSLAIYNKRAPHRALNFIFQISLWLHSSRKLRVFQIVSTIHSNGIENRRSAKRALNKWFLLLLAWRLYSSLSLFLLLTHQKVIFFFVFFIISRDRRRLFYFFLFTHFALHFQCV